MKIVNEQFVVIKNAQAHKLKTVISILNTIIVKTKSKIVQKYMTKVFDA